MADQQYKNPLTAEFVRADKSETQAGRYTVTVSVNNVYFERDMQPWQIIQIFGEIAKIYIRREDYEQI